MSRNKHSTKLCIKCPLHLKYVLALLCEIWSDRLSHQRNKCMYILMNHWIATNTTGNYCLSIIVRCVVYARPKSRHLYIICSKCSPPALTKARIDAVATRQQLFNRSNVISVTRACSAWSSTAWNSSCCPIFISLCKQAVKSSACPISL